MDLCKSIFSKEFPCILVPANCFSLNDSVVQCDTMCKFFLVISEIHPNHARTANLLYTEVPNLVVKFSSLRLSLLAILPELICSQLSIVCFLFESGSTYCYFCLHSHKLSIIIRTFYRNTIMYMQSFGSYSCEISTCLMTKSFGIKNIAQ